MSRSSSLLLIAATILLGPILYFVFQTQVEQPDEKRTYVYSVRSDFPNAKKTSYSPGPGAKILSSSFCRTRYYSVGNTEDLERQTVQFIYAYPTGSSNRTIPYRNTITDDARWMDGIFRSSSGGRLRIAWDKGGVCGNSYLDIITVRLPYSSRFYKSLGYARKAALLERAVTPHITPNKNYIVYADSVSPYMSDITGFGTMTDDSEASAENWNALGGNIAVLLGDGSVNIFGNYTQAVWQRREALLHEFVHTLGAVISGSPSATTGNHCRDRVDVMCYNDDGRGTRQVCPRAGKFHLDCGRNTYFNPGRPTGWLSTNWNIADSPFLVGSRFRGSS